MMFAASLIEEYRGGFEGLRESWQVEIVRQKGSCWH